MITITEDDIPDLQMGKTVSASSEKVRIFFYKMQLRCSNKHNFVFQKLLHYMEADFLILVSQTRHV